MPLLNAMMTRRDLLKLCVWEVINPRILNRKKSKVYPVGTSHTGINLGCGIDSPPGWIGVDGGATHIFVHKAPRWIARRAFMAFNMSKNYSFDEYVKKVKSMDIIHHDLTAGLPFADETVPHVFSSHFFEHIKRGEAIALLREAYRVMRPGGIIRICVPSLDDQVVKIRKAVEAYDQGDVVPIQEFVTVVLDGYYSPFSYHKWMYNFNEMKDVMTEAGFTDVKECSFGQGDIPDVEMLDTRRGLYVEGCKPVLKG